MNLRLLFHSHLSRSSNNIFIDDKDDLSYAADQNLSFQDRTSNTFASLIRKQKQGKSSLQEFGQSILPNKVKIYLVL